MKKGFNDGVSAIRIQKIGGINSPYNPFCIFNVYGFLLSNFVNEKSNQDH